LARTRIINEDIPHFYLGSFVRRDDKTFSINIWINRRPTVSAIRLFLGLQLFTKPEESCNNQAKGGKKRVQSPKLCSGRNSKLNCVQNKITAK